MSIRVRALLRAEVQPHAVVSARRRVVRAARRRDARVGAAPHWKL